MYRRWIMKGEKYCTVEVRDRETRIEESGWDELIPPLRKTMKEGTKG
jgi:hypothetical protein